MGDVIFVLMIALQFAGGENPSEIFRHDGLGMAIDLNSEVVVLPGEPEAKDTFQVEETVCDFAPLFIIDRARHTPLILTFVQASIGIIEDGLAIRSPGQDFRPAIR